MKNTIVILFAYILTFTSCTTTQQKENSERPSVRREKISFNTLQEIILQDNDTLYAVNFWATWCKPCIEELPGFIKVKEEMHNKPFKLILVSLDRPSDFETKVIPFLNEHTISADTYLLTDITTMNTWIPAVDSSWTGSIPATVFYKNKEKLNFQQEKISKHKFHSIISNNL
ncbi:MAG: TlpA family protein disulfide reductase [Bacteroidales bacterium]